MDDIHRKILRKFHTLCAAAGLTPDEKLAIVESRGVESSAEIDTHELIDICAALEKRAQGSKYGELDRLRKQTMASIGGWLKATRRENNAEVIKGIACRATGYDSFNKIPAERLRNLYHTFLNKQKDITSIDTLTAAISLQGFTAPTGDSVN